jgi:hypothetical protein
MSFCKKGRDLVDSRGIPDELVSGGGRRPTER